MGRASNVHTRILHDDLEILNEGMRGVQLPDEADPANSSDLNYEYDLAKSMDSDIYKAATTGDIDAFKQATEDRERSRFVQVTPQENTVLHLASSSCHDHLVELILEHFPDLLWKTNSMGNLALHDAASAGHLSTVKSLVHSAQEISKDVLMVANKEGNTALHLALKNQHKEVAMFLVESDPGVSSKLNMEEKSPLYMAAEAGWLELVKAMVENPDGIMISDDPFIRSNKSPVHAAITGKNRDILDTILSKDLTLINLRDEEGRTPLFYAASMGYLEGVHYLLDKFTQGVYQRERNGSFPIHIASAKGHIDIIQEFLGRFPDSMELVNAQGQNILHVAAMSGKFNVVSYMLKTRELEKLINERDDNGNTPLHLATMHWHPKVVSALTWDNRVKLEVVNNHGLTALDAAQKYIGTMLSFRKRLTWRALRSAGAPRAQRPRSTSGYIQTSTPYEPPSMEIYTERVNTLLLVSTLVVTVTFATGFTMPGGNNDSDPHLGMATLVTKRTFHAFLICNTIAMYSSIIATVTLIWAQLGDLSLVITALKLALPLLVVALTTMSIAFMAGVNLVVSNLNWLANLVLITGSVFLATFLVLFVPLCLPTSSSNRITRYIFYYPFYLVMVVTKSDTDDD